MAQNYTRQSSFADGDTITASLFNNEFNQVVNAFSYSASSDSSTGHKHDGTAGQGGNIPQIGDINFLNKIVVDSTNNRWGIFVEVAGGPVEQVRIQDGGIVPVTTNDIDLGTSALQFKDIFIDGTANIDSLVLSSGSTVTAILDEDDLVSDSATALATQQSIKAYVDAQVTAQDLDIVGDTGTDAIDLDSETLTFTGGTGITSVVTAGTVTHNIDSTVATLTGTQTLTNKTITSPDIDGGTVDGADITVGAAKTLDVSAGTLTLADNQISGDKVEGGTIAAITITAMTGTLQTAAQPNVTSLGTIASLVATTADINGGTVDGAIIGGTTAAAGSFTNITVSGTVDGRDVATDGTKLDGIEALADVTDTTNVTAAGALMDSELTNITAIKALNQGVATTDSPSFAGLTATTADINGGTIDGTTLGATTPASVAATTLSTTGAATIEGLTVGKGAGAVATNTAVGTSALAVNTSGATNTAIGESSLFSTTTGAGNTAVGYRTLYTNVSGTENTAQGYAALYYNTGNTNSAYGYQALFNNTTASNNTALGYQAGYTNTTGNSSVFVGIQAGYSHTTGAQNVAIGDRPMFSGAVSGNFNNAVGAFALRYLTSGSSNVAIGNEALQANTTASNNTAVGYQSLYGNTTASNNTAVGYQAGYSNTTGAQSVFVGQSAGYTNTTGTQQVFVGLNAGYSTTGNYNTFVGAGSGYSVSTGAKNTILGSYNGNQGGLDIRTASNHIVLSDGDGNPRAYWDAAGAATFGGAITTIGSAVAATNVQLTLNGVAAKAKRVAFASSGVDQWLIGQGAASENDAFEIYNTNGQIAVSIAKATSAATFSGTLSSGGITTTGNTAAGTASAGDGRLFPNNAYGAFVYGNGTTYDVALGQRSTGVALGVPAGTTNVVIPTGNVGIGAAAPESIVHIKDSGNVSTTLQIEGAATGYAPVINFDGIVAGNADYLLGEINGSWDTHTNVVSAIRFESGADTTNKDDGLISFWTSSSGPTLEERMRIDASGNLLVGKSATAFGTAGVEASASNGLWSTRSGLPALALNRLSTDGSIADLYKDGTIVGSIGTGDGDLVVASRNSKGFKIYAPNADGTSSILHPTTNATGSPLDAQMNLGYVLGRFKDLYLSGGVYLGGTGSANLLEDYEVGSFTPSFTASTTAPTIAYNTQTASYTKIGNTVTYTIFIVTNSRSGGSGNLSVTGLPFTVATGQDYGSTIGFNYNWETGGNPLYAFAQGSTTGIILYKSANNEHNESDDILASGNSYLRLTGFYYTTA
jgi:hypothetical protein